ncbi:general substrate transporter [Fomitiporia mediterranea MF3/22]|uniref:general substrate transporter n=1 Tax=Fomitiporia mediterranea (strain MF3/22) TaxID=694068 RepID=UPI00044081AA|nr:general substrate transporter [Fomitiporia mediterranea MF3/22]EJC99120.1 general substrate transporter [Fomitiporia mediterranea MF3/22]
MTRFTIRGLPISIFSILLALLASMGGFIFGYDTGQISDILLMDDFKARFAQQHSDGTFAFSDVRSGLIVSLLSIGTLIGALLGAPTADFFGRRNAMSMECGVFIIGVLIQITTFHAWYQFAIGRLIAGLGVGALSAAVPMYQAETAPPQIRGTLTGTYQLFITFGILVAYCISIGTRSMGDSGSWRTVVGIGIAWALVLGIGIRFMPESPRWSTRHGNTEAARAAIAKVRALPLDHPIVTNELDEILDSIEIEQGIDKARLASGDIPAKSELKGENPHWTKGWIDCFKGFRAGSSRIGYRTLLGMSLQSLQQLTGANYFFYYGATIFQSVGISDSYVTQIILGAVNFVCTFLGLYIMERYGRRIPLIVGGLWQSAWLFVFAAAGTAKNPRDNPEIGKLMIVSACLFILGYASTWAPGIWILIGETFPTRSRAKQGALSTASNWLWNFLLAFFTPFIVSAIDFRYGFIFASCNLLGAIVVYFFLYESSGMSLENVDLMYRDASAKPWNSRSWAPPGYASRADVEAEKPRNSKHYFDKDAEKQSAGAGSSVPNGGGNGYTNGELGAGTALGAEEDRKENI